MARYGEKYEKVSTKAKILFTCRGFPSRNIFEMYTKTRSQKEIFVYVYILGVKYIYSKINSEYLLDYGDVTHV